MNKIKELFNLHNRKIIILLFIFLYLFGLFFIKDIGANFDEQTEQTILKMNIYEYARMYSSDNDIVKYY